MSWTPNQVMGVVEMGEGSIAVGSESVSITSRGVKEIGVRTDDSVDEDRSAFFDVWMPEYVIWRVAGAVEDMERRERIYGSRCSRFEWRAWIRGLQECVNARVLGGPSAVTENTASDTAGEEARSEWGTEGSPCWRMLV
jgi:hypothetical protein